MTILPFYTLQTGQYFKWRILIIEHIKFSATTIFTLKLIFIWSWFETIYTHFLIIFARSFSINCRLKLFKMRFSFWRCCHFIHYKMINLDSITNENNKEHNEKWPYIPDHPYRILIIPGSGSRKTNNCLTK